MSLTNAITEFDAAYQELLALAAGYPADKRDQSGACGAWSPQQVLAHLGGWLLEAHRRYDRFPLGTGDYQYNHDGFNAVSVKRRAHYTWDDIVTELQTLYTALRDRAAAIQPTTEEREPRYAEWLHGLARDAREHTQQLRAFVGH